MYTHMCDNIIVTCSIIKIIILHQFVINVFPVGNLTFVRAGIHMENITEYTY